MRIKITFIILMPLFFGCCSDINDSERVKFFKSNFTDEPFQMMKIDDGIYKFKGVTNPTGIVSRGYCRLFYSLTPNEKEFDKVVKKLKSQTIYNCKFNHSENLFSPDFRKDDIVNKYPVPDINDSFFQLSEVLDFESSSIFVFKTEKGNFFKSEAIKDIEKSTNLKKHEIDKIGNGFSNGAFVDYSSRKIIFWVIIW